MGFLRLSCFSLRPRTAEQPPSWNFAGNCDKDEKRMWGTVHWLLKFLSRRT